MFLAEENTNVNKIILKELKFFFFFFIFLFFSILLIRLSHSIKTPTFLIFFNVVHFRLFSNSQFYSLFNKLYFRHVDCSLSLHKFLFILILFSLLSFISFKITELCFLFVASLFEHKGREAEVTGRG